MCLGGFGGVLGWGFEGLEGDWGAFVCVGEASVVPRLGGGGCLYSGFGGVGEVLGVQGRFGGP